MPVKFIILATLLFGTLLVQSCSNTEGDKTSNSKFDNEKKDSIASRYHQTSNYFLQPSHMYRIYKDSALQIQPKNVDIRQRLSYSYKKRGEHIKAMQVLNEAVNYGIEQNNTDVIGYRAWSLLYYYRDYQGAINDIDLIEKMTGSLYNICWGEPCGFQKGQAYYKLKRYNEAIKAFKQVNTEEIKRGFDVKDNIYIFYYMGRCYEEQKLYDTAIKYYNKALNSYTTFPEALFRIGKIYTKLSKDKEAIHYFNQAKENIHYKMGEPYIERFDELFPYMVDHELKKLIKIN